MGSFATCLQIRSSDAGQIAQSLRRIMFDAGYLETDETPGDDAVFGGRLRAIVVCKSSEGWVGVFDSDLMQSISLAAALSKRHNIPAMHFMVHDSDSWHYALHASGRKIDEFDSSGGEESDLADDETAGAYAAPPPFDPRQEELIRRAQELQAKIDREMPADLRSIRDRAIQGRATTEELSRFQQWMIVQQQATMRELSNFLPPDFQRRQQEQTARIREAMSPHIRQIADRAEQGTVTPAEAAQLRDWIQENAAQLQAIVMGNAAVAPPPDDDSDASPQVSQASLDSPELKGHAEKLQSTLNLDIPSDQLIAALAQQPTFAEHAMQDFMKLIGINPEFANLSYTYLGESTPDELRASGIEIERHLRFATDRPQAPSAISLF